MARRLRSVLITGAVAGGLAGLLVAGPTVWAYAVSVPHLKSPDEVPPRPVGLVLGAQAYDDGTPSPMLAARVTLAADLYHRGKVRVLLVSGAAGANRVNEPDVMRAGLVAAGVPDGHIVSDFAGFNTYNSCVRARRVFGVTSLTVISQSYHLPRAVATCRSVGLDAVGVGDETTRTRFAWKHGALREWGSRMKMVFDLVSRREAVLGPHEDGVERALHDG